MGREIKFRIWNEDEIIYDVGIDPDCIAYKIPEDAYNSENFDYYPEAEIMQFTGLKDKNDVDIYEGDIVIGYDDTALIKYDNYIEAGGKFYPDFSVGKDEGWDWWSDKERWYWFEVIGNIYENPELLENKENT